VKTSLELINEFEQTFRVENWKVNNLHIWPAIRIPLMTAWEQTLYYKDLDISRNKTTTYYRVISDLKQLILGLLSKNNNTVKNYEAGVWGLDVERLLIDGKYYSPYGDGLRDLEFKNELLCLDLTLKSVKVNHYPCADITLGYLSSRYIAKLYSMIKIRTVKAPLSDAVLWCEERGLPSVGLTLSNLAYQYELLRLVKNYFVRIIQTYKMKICFKVCWYDHVGMALSWACKELTIPCYDLQHGIAGATISRAYSSWSSIPPEGYNLIPDGFWCWTDSDAKAIRSWGSKLSTPIKVFVGGNVWNRVWKDNKLSITPSLNNKVKSDNIKILFTLQPMWSSAVPDLLADLIKKSPIGWTWLIRCHPMNMENMSLIDCELKKINTNSIIDLVNTTKQLLPSVLMNVDIHITGWSAVVFDAKEFGIKSILCHPSAKILFEDTLKNDDALYIDDADDIVSEIKLNLASYRKPAEAKIYPSFREFLKNNEI